MLQRRGLLALCAASLIAVSGLTLAPSGLASESMVEVHRDALSGSAYQRAGDYASDFPESLAADGTWELLPTADGTPVIGFIKLQNTGSGTVEVHGDALNGTVYKRVWDFASHYTPAQAANGVMQLFGASGGAPELGYIDLRNTGSGTVEVHWETLQNGVYTDAGDYASDFSPSDAGNGTWQLFWATGAPELGFVKTFPPPPPPPGVEPVVETQSLPVPPPASAGRHRRPSIRARFVIGWTWNHARTRLHAVRVTGVPRNVRIEVRCRGAGCPARAVTARHRGLGRLLRSLEGQVFRAGDVLTIAVSAPNRRPERITVRIRDGKEPDARLL